MLNMLVKAIPTEVIDMTIYELMLHDAIDTMLIDEQDFSGRCRIASILSSYGNPNNFGNFADQLHDAMGDIQEEIINSSEIPNLSEDNVLTSLLWLERVYRASAIRS